MATISTSARILLNERGRKLRRMLLTSTESNRPTQSCFFLAHEKIIIGNLTHMSIAVITTHLPSKNNGGVGPSQLRSFVDDDAAASPSVDSVNSDAVGVVAVIVAFDLAHSFQDEVSRS